MKKKIGLILMAILMLASLPALAAPGQSPRPVDAKLWPLKAAWPGQKVGFFRAKLYASASYLLVFPQPGQAIAGVDQLFFARKLIGKTYTIQGLYKLPTKGAAEYYWRLDGPAGEAPVWVKDSQAGQLSSLPFVLGREIAEENRQIADLQALKGKMVWINRNHIVAGELSGNIGHLQPLTIVSFKSAGPFSETYSISFTQADGAALVWELKPTGSRAAYNHSQFREIFRQSFYDQDPLSLHPDWQPAVRELIKDREIRVGWDSDMVLMSWGEPDRRNTIEIGPEKGLTLWLYPEGAHLYFKGKNLVKIKIPRPADSRNKGPQIRPADQTGAAGKDKSGQDGDLMDVPGAAKERKSENAKEAA